MSTCMNADDALNKANEEVLEKNYKSALEMYNLSIELDDKVTDSRLKRAHCLTKLRKYKGFLYSLTYCCLQYIFTYA